MIREARLEDAGRIAEIHVETWRVAYLGLVPDDYLKNLDQDHRKRVWTRIMEEQSGKLWIESTVEGAVVGFCHFLPSRDDDSSENTGEITAIYIDPAFWRRGFGGHLCKQAIDHAREIGFNEISLWVLEGNSRAIGFYENAGFHFDGTQKSEQRPGFTLDEMRYRRNTAETG